jgi:hypothetical protein
LELQSLIATCEYNTQRDSILRDQIVIGVADIQTREKLLFDPQLTLAKAVEILRACETSSSIAEKMSAEAVNRLTLEKFKQSKPSGHGQSDRRGSADKSEHRGSGGQITNCKWCGGSHARRRCPAYGKQCTKCGKPNHFEKVCNNEENVASMDHYVIHSLSDRHDSQWNVELLISDCPITFKVDTGASCNVLSRHWFDKVNRSKSQLQPGPQVRTYTGQSLNVLGQQDVVVFFKKKRYTLRVIVIEEEKVPILGLPSCRELGLVQTSASQQVDTLGDSSRAESTLPSEFKKYQNVFTGIGKLPVEHQIKLKEDYVSVVRPPRRVPFKLRDPVKKKLDEMEKLKLVCKVTEPTEWVNPMLAIQKSDGDVRICLDPVDLNKEIKRQHYPVPTAQELFARIGKAKYFSSLDATSGFLQIPLTEESSYMTTFATPFGRYRFLRLPFGISSAPEVYQQTMDQFFGDLEGVEIYLDDFFVWGETRAEHDQRLTAVFDRCVKVNLKLNASKCKFLLPELPWIGHVISFQQLKPDPAKVSVITAFKEPSSKEELQRLLGMVNYLSKFCEHLSPLTKPLRDLLKSDVEWVWDSSSALILKSVKELVSTAPVLRLFDPKLPVTVSVDASPYGLGAVLLQAGQPIEFASRSLTDTQRRYAQIEKELLAVQFGMTHFHHYVYGNQVTVETDHKPLVGLVDKPIGLCFPRIQRMRLQLQVYSYQLFYRPGKELVLADTLSRAPDTQEYATDQSQINEEYVHAMLSYVIPEETVKEKFAKATQSDPTLQLVVGLVENGWPHHKRDCPVPAKPFWSERASLSTAGGLLLRGHQIVVPVSLQSDMLKQIHDGHFGESKCLERAKSVAYWPGYVEEIRNLVAGCRICQERRHQNPHQQHYPVEVPEYPFQRVATDFFQLRGKDYLLAVDYFSKWPSVVEMSSTTSAATIKELDKLFSDFGVPEVLVSDNGPQFGSADFRAFARHLAVSHVTSSPFYPESNGLAERSVQTVKAAFIKSMEDGRTLQDTLRAIRSTPVGGGLPSPSVLLQSRNLRGSLPFLSEFLRHQNVSSGAVAAELKRRQVSAAFHKKAARPSRYSILTIG